jgi:antitoxin ParD1/3/4
MNVSLTPELEKLVNEKVKSGLYNSASEVIREGLRLLQEQDELKRIRRDELRREIMLGVEQIRRGEYRGSHTRRF